MAGFQSFNTAFGTSVSFAYCIEAVDANGTPTGEWEVGVGHLSGASTLVRDAVRDSSNSGAAVSLSTGTKNVYNAFPAAACRRSSRDFAFQYGLP